MTTATLEVGRTVGLLVLALSAAVSTRAAVLSPLYLADYTSQYAFDGRTADKIYDGNKVTTAVNQMWLSMESAPQLTYMFDARCRLDSLNVWNYNEAGSQTTRGIKDVQISYSNDWGRTYSAPISTTFAQAPGNLTITPTTVALGGVYATNVRIKGMNTYGDSWAGLTEVESNGTSTTAPMTKVTGVTVASVSSEYSLRLGAYTLDGNKDNTDPNNAAWHSNFGDHTPTITYQFGMPRNVDHLLIWNFNEAVANNSSRGFKDFEVSVSAEGTIFTPVTDPLDGDTTFTLFRNNGLVPALTNYVYLGGVSAVYMRLHALNSYGDVSDVTGLNEVEFYVPEPATAGILCLGALCLGWRQRRR